MASPRVIMPQVQVPGARQGEGRVGRRPETHFELVFKPYQIQPFCFFPVLPGETLMNCNVQLQLWTDPLKAILKNQLWHAEVYFYYVKFRDLPGWEDPGSGLGHDLIDMIESNEALTPWLVAGGNAWSGCPKYGVDYVRYALQRVVESYWRDEGVAAEGAGLTVDSVPISTVLGARRDVTDRFTVNASYTDRRQALDWDASGTITVDDVEMAYREWVGQKDGEMSMDYEDWVRAAGGKAVTKSDEREELHLPEELTGFREFTYPVNTVEPSTGVPSVAVGWRLRKGLRKMFRFEEWGWVLGVVNIRPKLLHGNQNGLFADMMQTRDNWFPPNMDPRSWQPHLNIAEDKGPLESAVTVGQASYWVNLRDLLKYGEQFTNYVPTPTNGAFAATPNTTGNFFPASGDVMAPFSDTTNGRIRAAGVVQCGFKTHKIVVSSEEPDSLALGKW
jgi:hypothetical protein